MPHSVVLGITGTVARQIMLLPDDEVDDSDQAASLPADADDDRADDRPGLSGMIAEPGDCVGLLFEPGGAAAAGYVDTVANDAPALIMRCTPASPTTGAAGAGVGDGAVGGVGSECAMLTDRRYLLRVGFLPMGDDDSAAETASSCRGWRQCGDCNPFDGTCHNKLTEIVSLLPCCLSGLFCVSCCCISSARKLAPDCP